MNFLQFQFRFGLFSGISRWGFLGIGFIAVFFNQHLLGTVCFAGFALLLGFDINSWGYYKHGAEYFTVQPENLESKGRPDK
jgi:hypothetical protein